MVRPIIVLALLWLVAQDHEKRRDELASKLESLRGLKFKSPLVLRDGTRREYAAYVLEHIGGQSHAYTWDEFRARYERHFGVLAIA